MASITGTTGEDELFGGGDADVIQGLGGDDLLWGDDGDDVLDGGDGDDLLYDDRGDDLLIGGDGFDRVMMGGWPTDFDVRLNSNGQWVVTDRSGHWGSATLDGVERLVFGGDEYFADLDDLVAEGTSSDDTITGTAGFDWLHGNAGDDALSGGGGTNLVDGGDGDDTALYAGASTDYRIFVNPEGLVQVDLITVDGEDVMLLGSDVLIGIEHLSFGGDSTTLDTADVPALGTGENDLLIGSAGNDFLFGLSGDDDLDAGSGNDWVSGGSGDDVYAMGAGDDYAFDRDFDGNGGDDLYLYEPGDGDDRIDDETGYDVLAFGAGIDPSDVVVTLDEYGFSYILTFTDRAGSVVLEGSASDNPVFAMEEVRFADETVWTAEDLAAFACPPPEAPLGGGEFLP